MIGRHSILNAVISGVPKLKDFFEKCDAYITSLNAYNSKKNHNSTLNIIYILIKFWFQTSKRGKIYGKIKIKYM